MDECDDPVTEARPGVACDWLRGSASLSLQVQEILREESHAGAAGCDYQFAGGFVIGVAGGYAWTDASGAVMPAWCSPGFVNHTKIDWLASVRTEVYPRVQA